MDANGAGPVCFSNIGDYGQQWTYDNDDDEKNYFMTRYECPQISSVSRRPISTPKPTSQMWAKPLT